MMKAIILSLGLISTINASSQRLLQQVGCANVRCSSGTFCIEDPIAGAQCVSSCPGANEEYNSCGSACPAVCGVDGPEFCIQVCVQGCFCADGYIRDTNGNCIPEGSCAACPLRCEAGFDGCNDCFCDGLGNTVGCTRRGCPNGPIAPAGCKTCEVGYTLNTVTNECESAKVSCSNRADCDQGFRCRKDPECREYSDLRCGMTGKVCVSRKALETPCTSDSDCDEANGFACLDGDNGEGRCVKYQQSLCGTNEEFTPCNGHCRPTCATGPNIICTLQCEPGCNCIDGYILDQEDGTCIPQASCP